MVSWNVTEVNKLVLVKQVTGKYKNNGNKHVFIGVTVTDPGKILVIFDYIYHLDVF